MTICGFIPAVWYSYACTLPDASWFQRISRTIISLEWLILALVLPTILLIAPVWTLVAYLALWVGATALLKNGVVILPISGLMPAGLYQAVVLDLYSRRIVGWAMDS